MSNDQQTGYGVCRSIEDAQTIAATAERDGLKGCYPSAAVVLARSLEGYRNNQRELPGYSELVQIAATPEVGAPFDYIGEAVSTLSNKFHGELVSLSLFESVLANAIKALQDLDAVKKTLFYGKALPAPLDQGWTVGEKNCNGLPEWFKNPSFGEMVIHAAIGGATESGEQLEAIYNVVVHGQTFDEINIKEETGDQMWYNAVMAHACGFNFDEAQRINIAKLRKRYPQKFTEYDAMNRDLIEERRILSK